MLVMPSCNAAAGLPLWAESRTNAQTPATHASCSMPAVQGVRFGELHAWFDDGTPLGLVNTRTGACSFNPPNSTFVREGETHRKHCCVVEDL